MHLLLLLIILSKPTKNIKMNIMKITSDTHQRINTMVRQTNNTWIIMMVNTTKVSTVRVSTMKVEPAMTNTRTTMSRKTNITPTRVKRNVILTRVEITAADLTRVKKSTPMMKSMAKMPTIRARSTKKLNTNSRIKRQRQPPCKLMKTEVPISRGDALNQFSQKSKLFYLL